MSKGVVLLSGGLDSATVLYYAKNKGVVPYCLIFDYGQRHKKELSSARKLAEAAGCEYQIVRISLPWKGSSLLDRSMEIETREVVDSTVIPSTYVPARNIIFLSFAASYAEVISAEYIFIGANAIDYSGYPDCRPEFFKSYQQALKRGLKTGVQGKDIKVVAPLIRKSKGQIIKLGLKLGVPYELTWSCYKGDRYPCSKCDSCRLRAKGFEQAGVDDPLFKNRR